MSDETKINNIYQSEELRQILNTRFGDNWRQSINLQVRSDELYWLILLVEEGVKARIRDARTNGELDRMDFRLSVASWRMDIEKLVNQVKDAPIVKPKKKKPTK